MSWYPYMRLYHWKIIPTSTIPPLLSFKTSSRLILSCPLGCRSSPCLGITFRSTCRRWIRRRLSRSGFRWGGPRRWMVFCCWARFREAGREGLCRVWRRFRRQLEWSFGDAGSRVRDKGWCLPRSAMARNLRRSWSPIPTVRSCSSFCCCLESSK